MTVTDIQVRPTTAVVSEGEFTVETMVKQAQKIQECMKQLMKPDQHYGVIPGTDKPTLLKPGAEKLCLMFRLDPEYDVIKTVETSELFSYTVRCTLYHIPTGSRIASGLGSCNSREDKYRRPAAKKCPKCSKETILRSKLREGERGEPGWFCWAKKGGCGANFAADDPAVVTQDNGIKDPSDLANTILKMGCKRALVAAVLNGTAASDCFTQDLEDLSEKADGYAPPAPKAARANTVKHDGKKASPESVKLLHVLRGKVGGLVFCSDKDPCTPGEKACAYHKQLAAFKGADGKPIRSSKDLAPEQMDNLLERYKAKIRQQEMRAEEAINEVSSAVNERVPGEDDDEGEAPTPDDLAALQVAAEERWNTDTKKQFPRWLKDVMNYDSVMEMTARDVHAAIRLVREGE